MATESFTRRIELDKKASETLRERLERGAEHVWESQFAARGPGIKIGPVTSDAILKEILKNR